MKRVVYLGYVVSAQEANNLSGASIAGNKMQLNVLENLTKYSDLEICCVTITPLASFPHEKKIFQNYFVDELFAGVKSFRAGFLNLPIIKQFWQIFSVYSVSKRIVKQMNADTIFMFNLFPQIGIPMRLLKRKFPELDTVCLLADLPIDDNTNRNSLSSLFRKKFDKSTWNSMKVCDRFIVLNQYVIENYIPGKPYIVIDGGIDENDISASYDSNTLFKEHNILFSGALTEYNGIKLLLNAMNFLKDKDIYLDIYGDGYLKELVEVAAKENSKIRFHGRVSNKIVIEKQKEAWLLVNPRLVNDPISKVTFPSKTFEYLLSGTPVLSTKLNGYSREYDDLMYWINDNSPEQLAFSITNLLSLSNEDYISITTKSRNFILNNKMWSMQCDKIHDFLMEEN